MSVPDVRGWKRIEAEAALRQAGVKRIGAIVVSPPRGRVTGDERVLRQVQDEDDVVILTLAREMVRADARRQS